MFKKQAYPYHWRLIIYIEIQTIVFIIFFSIIKSFPKINYWLPHLGCGVFLHWKRVNNICKFQPSLLSSTNDLSEWNVMLKNKYLKSLPIKFASDHPFNGLDSLKIYDVWIKNFKK